MFRSDLILTWQGMTRCEPIHILQLHIRDECGQIILYSKKVARGKTYYSLRIAAIPLFTLVESLSK